MTSLGSIQWAWAYPIKAICRPSKTYVFYWVVLGGRAEYPQGVPVSEHLFHLWPSSLDGHP